jgi:bacillithiol biosynthesis cysteine-adding enzyme BshC
MEGFRYSTPDRMTAPSVLPATDVVEAGLVPRLVAAWLAGRERDLLHPLRLAERPVVLPPAPNVDRRALAAALAQANASYGHARADELARKLADPATRVVVTGQQPGLFGGPLYTVTKALAAAKWAAELEARGESAVAVFWIATEDHDFAEVANAMLLGPEGPVRVGLGEDPQPLAPLGMRTFGATIEVALAELRAALPGERWAAALDGVARWYRPEARFGEAFARLMTHLLGPHCPLLLDAMLPAVKAAEGPWLERLVERRREVEAGLDAADARLRERGYTPQVERHPGASPLFVLQGEARRRVIWTANGFTLRGEGVERPLEELQARIAENPGAVSPSALARPALQDAILGTSVFVVGPGELAYLAQAAAVYAALEAPAPLVALRPQALVLEGHQPEHLQAWGGSLADLLAENADLDRLVSRGSGAAIAQPARERIGAALGELRAPALALDPSLERPLEKTHETIERALEAFSHKLEAAAARRDETTRSRLLRLRGALRPGGVLQERALATLHFPAKYGPGFIEQMWGALELEPRRLQIVTVE